MVAGSPDALSLGRLVEPIAWRLAPLLTATAHSDVHAPLTTS